MTQHNVLEKQACVQGGGTRSITLEALGAASLCAVDRGVKPKDATPAAAAVAAAEGAELPPWDARCSSRNAMLVV